MIKIDMQMPECCMKCPFYSGYSGGKCLVDEYDSLCIGCIYADMERHPRCPLQEVDDDGI